VIRSFDSALAELAVRPDHVPTRQTFPHLTPRFVRWAVLSPVTQGKCKANANANGNGIGVGPLWQATATHRALVKSPLGRKTSARRRPFSYSTDGLPVCRSTFGVLILHWMCMAGVCLELLTERRAKLGRQASRFDGRANFGFGRITVENLTLQEVPAWTLESSL
jgi:hypothetical protein